MDYNSAIAATLITLIIAQGCVVASSNWADGQASVAAAQAGLQQCPVKVGWRGELAWQKECEK